MSTAHRITLCLVLLLATFSSRSAQGTPPPAWNPTISNRAVQSGINTCNPDATVCAAVFKVSGTPTFVTAGDPIIWFGRCGSATNFNQCTWSHVRVFTGQSTQTSGGDCTGTSPICCAGTQVGSDLAIAGQIWNNLGSRQNNGAIAYLLSASGHEGCIEEIYSHAGKSDSQYTFAAEFPAGSGSVSFDAFFDQQYTSSADSWAGVDLSSSMTGSNDVYCQLWGTSPGMTTSNSSISPTQWVLVYVLDHLALGCEFNVNPPTSSTPTLSTASTGEGVNLAIALTN
jgi:hypothetical protein